MQLRKDAVFRADSAGAMIALVPYAPPARAARVNITLDETLLARVDRAAETAGETRSGYLADAARRRLAAEAGAPEVAYASAAPAVARLDEPARRFRGAKRVRTAARKASAKAGRAPPRSTKSKRG
jgi:hypothetical protein